MNKTMRKIIIVVLVGVLVLTAIFAVYWFSFRQVYWKGQKVHLPQITDVEYLDVLDMRFVSENNELKELGNTLTKASFDTHAKDAEKYTDTISSELFTKLDPKHREGLEDNITDEEFEITRSNAVSNGNKGIYFCHIRYSANSYDGANFGMSNKSCPIRVYFEKKNDKWVVIDINAPIT